MSRILYGAIVALAIGCIILVLLSYYGILSLNLIISLDTTQISVIATIIGLVITTALSVYAVRYQRKVAEASVFTKAVLEVVVMGQRLIPNSEFSEIDFGYSVGKDDIVFCVIPFAIRNTGELSAENVQVRLSFPLALRGGESLMKNVKFEQIMGAYDKSDIKRRAYRHESSEYVDYLLPEIGPHQTCMLEEPIDVTYSSSIPMKVDAVSKDKVPLTIELDFLVSSRVDVGVSAKDIAPASGHFFVRAFATKDMKELQAKVTEDRVKALTEMRDDPQAFKRNLPDLLKNAIAVTPELRKVPKPKKGPQIKGTAYMEEPKQSKRALLQVSGRKKLVVKKQKNITS